MNKQEKVHKNDVNYMEKKFLIPLRLREQYSLYRKRRCEKQYKQYSSGPAVPV